MTAGSGRALLVLHDVAGRQEIATALAEIGFVTTEVSSFEAARRALGSPVDLLVTDVRLHDYNGLHLVLRARSTYPGVAAVVTSTIADAMLQREAEALGATFVVLPVGAADLRAAVLRTARRKVSEDAEPIHAPFERRGLERRQTVRAVAAELNRRVRGRREADRARPES